jgi:arylsulfatase A-like enzyme
LIAPDKVCFAKPLSEAGVSTAIFGKWHLGEYSEYLPTERGFQHGFIIPNPHKQGDFGLWETRPAVKTPTGTYQSDHCLGIFPSTTATNRRTVSG